MIQPSFYNVTYVYTYKVNDVLKIMRTYVILKSDFCSKEYKQVVFEDRYDENGCFLENNCELEHMEYPKGFWDKQMELINEDIEYNKIERMEKFI